MSKKAERNCCKNCEYRDYERDWNGSRYFVIASKSCPYWANIEGNYVKEWFHVCQYYKRKETFEHLKHKEGDVVFIIDRNAYHTKTKPIIKTKVSKVEPTNVIAPYAIKMKEYDEAEDKNRTLTVYAKEEELYDSYEEAWKAYDDELVDKLWKLDEEYKNKNWNIIDRIDYLEKYKST